MFRFLTETGNVNIVVAPLDVDSPINEAGSETQGANLAVQARILDAAGNEVAVGVDTGSVDLGSMVDVTLDAGLYFLEVDGAGRGTDGTDGFTDYASLGEYTISGVVAAPPIQVTGGNRIFNPIFNGDTSIFTNNNTDFGFARPGVSVQGQFQVRNSSSTTALTNFTISLSNNSDFQITTSPIPSTIPPGATLPFTIVYTPQGTGIDLGTVNIDFIADIAQTFNFTIGGSSSNSANEDNYEENDTVFQAYNLAENTFLSEDQGLGWMTDQRDFYDLTVAAGDQLITVDVFHEAENGQILFELYRAPQVLLASTSEGGVQTLQYLITNDPTSDYFIRVTPLDGTSLENTYDLRWRAESLSGGGTDPYEENDSLDQAFNLSLSSQSRLSEIFGPATLDDDDWYRIDVERDPFIRFIYVSLEYTAAEGDLDEDISFQLFDGNLVELGNPITSVGRDLITHFEQIFTGDVADDWSPPGNTAINGILPGTYYVRVFGNNDGREYDLFFGTIEDDLYEQIAPNVDNDEPERCI